MNKLATLVLTFLPFLATIAQASGSLSMPETRQTIKNHAACLKLLDEAYDRDQAQASLQTVSATGLTRLVGFESSTGGPKKLGRRHIHYIGRVWFCNGRLRPEFNQVETNHSWQETNMECRGRQLIVRPRSGFTLSTFSPVPAPTPK